MRTESHLAGVGPGAAVIGMRVLSPRGSATVGIIFAVLAVASANPTAAQDVDPPAPDRARITELRDRIASLRTELERREERRDLIERQERALYEIALATGLDARLPADRAFPIDPPEPVLLADGRTDLGATLAGRPDLRNPTGERARALDAFHRWRDRAIRGEVRLDALGSAAAEVREVAAARGATLAAAIDEDRASRGEILRLTTEIRRTIESIETPFSEATEADLVRILRDVDDVRAVVEGDDLAARATTVDAALAGLLRTPGDPGTR